MLPGAAMVLICLNAPGQTNLPMIYDDGFIGPDISGSTDGLTWYWGYTNSSQIAADGTMLLHVIKVRDARTIELTTDAYSTAGIIAPSAPYAGTYAGPGPLIPMSSTRTVTLVSAPSLQMTATRTNVLLSWPVTSYDFILQTTTNLANPVAWKTATKTPDVINGQNTFAPPHAPGSHFYRLILTLQ
jgi:hypothetical protein